MKVLIFTALFFFVSCNVVQTLTDGETKIDNDFYKTSGGPFGLQSLHDGLISFYKFEDYSGGTYVDRQGQNLLTETASLTSPVVGGIRGTNSTDCNGYAPASHMTNTSVNGVQFPPGQDFSVAFWVKRGTQAPTPAFVFRLDYNGVHFSAQQPGTSDDMQFTLGGHTVTHSNAFSDTNWKHVVLRVERGVGSSTCLNGVCGADDSFNLTDNFTYASVVLTVCTNGVSTVADMQIDSLGFWDRMLSNDEVQALYNGNNDLDNN